MKFKKKSKITEGIPTASMPDIVFMLLIFFMVSTVLKQYEGLKVSLPQAKKIEKLETKRYVSYIWIDENGNITIDDKPGVKVTDLRTLVYDRLIEDPRLIVSLKTDKMANFGVVSDVHEELREAGALRVNYSAKPKG